MGIILSNHVYLIWCIIKLTGEFRDCCRGSDAAKACSESSDRREEDSERQGKSQGFLW